MKKTLKWYHALGLALGLMSAFAPVIQAKQIDRFADIRILQYEVQGFDKLPLERKKFVYYLAQAALAGRDITWDQNYEYNLLIRRTFEGIISTYRGNKESDQFKKFMTYVKQMWLANGIHHHYSYQKFTPEFTREFFVGLVMSTPAKALPKEICESRLKLADRIADIIFDPKVAPKKTNKQDGVDLVKTSAVNFYQNLTQQEVRNFYKNLEDPNDPEPISYGLNSRLVKTSWGIKEQVYSSHGRYKQAIRKIVYWLEKALPFACTPEQKASLEKLIEFYEHGDLRDFDEYSVLWVHDTKPQVDVISGFIEVYDDPLALKGTYESVVFLENLEMTEKFGALAKEAQWFEDHSPIDPAYKKDVVSGISYKVISVAMEAGGSSPATPIGINLPNSDWIRAKHGSKSVSLGNIEDAYHNAETNSGYLEEFYLPEQQEWIRAHGDIVGRLTTGLHEVVGHASGRLKEGVGTPDSTLKNYSSALEEGRADLVALYYIGDQHLVDIGLTPTTDVMKAEYTSYLFEGLAGQLKRIKVGDDIEEDHMRNRHFISAWVLEKAGPEVVQLKKVDGKTRIEIKDFNKLREYFGMLLKEVQRIKSEGDFEAGKNLVENYGVKVDQELQKEILERYGKLNLAPYSGFVNPYLTPEFDKTGAITDIKVSYEDSFENQMLKYGKEHSFLPTKNK